MVPDTVAAIVGERDAPFRLSDVRLDDPQPHEAIVRMRATGICHTDLSVRSGVIPFPLPAVLGHEGAGVVEAVGSAIDGVRVGDQVLLSFAACGWCSNCVGGHPAYCQQHASLNLLSGARLDGTPTMWQGGEPLHGHFFGQSSFAELALVHESCMVPVRSDIPVELLAPLGCGLQTGAGTILNVLRPRVGSSIVVFGAGPVGLAAVMAAAMLPVEPIVVVDRLPERLSVARSLGATHIVDTAWADVAHTIRELTHGIGVNFSVEATGNTDVLQLAIDVLAPRGTCAVIGVAPVGAYVSVGGNFLLPGRRLVGVTEGDSTPRTFIPTLIKLMESGKFAIEKLVRSYSFADIESAAADAAAGSAIKPVLSFSG
jgi:aryl-alcohol dehydrogenase